MLVSLVDEEPGQRRRTRGAVTLAMPTIVVRDLIRARLELELERLRDEAADRLTDIWLARHGAVPLAHASKGRPSRPEVEALVAVALAGFERGRYFVLVNDRQVMALDEVVTLAETTEVTFLRLTPLQGG